MEGGTDDSLNGSDDRFTFPNFSWICAPEADYYVCRQNALNCCTLKINDGININTV